MTAEPIQPAQVRDWVARFRRVGMDPVVELGADHRWKLSVSTEHAETVTYLWKHGRRWRYRSTLIVDGRKRDTARNAQELAEIFHEANFHGPPRRAQPWDFPTDPHPRIMPPPVEQCWRGLRAGLGEHAEQVRIGYAAHTNSWIVGADIATVSLRIGLRKLNHRQWMQPVQLIIGGVDLSEEVADDMGAAMARAAAAIVPAAPAKAGPATTATPASSARDRKGTVMRI